MREQDAWEYVAGFTCINDMYCRSCQSWFGENPSAYEQHAKGTLDKAVDGCGGIGPALVPRDTIPDPYNLLTYTRENGLLKNRAYTGSYLIHIEYLIAYLSRFMTLPAGTVISLGAAGWDGVMAYLPKRSREILALEVEIESVGCMRNNLTRSAAESDYASSPFLELQNRRQIANIPMGPSQGNNVWMLRGNYQECETVENIPCPASMCPHLLPTLSLADTSSPLIIPPHATNLSLTCQLAGIIGKSAYHVSKEQAWDYFSGLALMVALHDSSLVEPITRPSCYEQRAAFFLGSCGDGFNRISAPIAVKEILPRLNDLPMTLQSNGQSASTLTRDYLHSLADMLVLISHDITLLPGDVLALGPAGASLVIPEAVTVKGPIKAALGDAVRMELFPEDRSTQSEPKRQ